MNEQEKFLTKELAYQKATKSKYVTGSFWKEHYFEPPYDTDDSDFARSKRATQRIMNILCGQSLTNEDVDAICRVLAICRNPHIEPPYKLVVRKK